MLTYWRLGLYSLRRRRFISIGMPIIDLRRSSDRLRFITGIPIPVRRRLLSEYRPWTGQMSPVVMHKRNYPIEEDWHVLHEFFRRLKRISHLAWMFYQIHLCIYCPTTFCRSELQGKKPDHMSICQSLGTHQILDTWFHSVMFQPIRFVDDGTRQNKVFQRLTTCGNFH